MSEPPALDETQLAPEGELSAAVDPVPSATDTYAALPAEPPKGGPRHGFKVGAIDAERLRAAVASRLFGVEAEPVKIGRFTVLTRLGAGGMGVVYSAYDDQLDRKLAIKLLRGEESEQRRARLLREAQALARVSHPNVISVYEVGTFRTQVFVAMEFVRGATLGEVESKSKDSLGEILGWFRQAGRGLAAAHAAGLVHRDFKPENCLVGDDGRVRVLDFGLARAAGEDGVQRDELDEEERRQIGASTSAGSTSDSLDAPLTRTGAIMGTPAYMAPEQHLGIEVDARTDQFSFCVSLWERLYGERPFGGDSLAQLSLAVTGGMLRDPVPGKNVPKWVYRALARGLSVHPDKRWPDMESLIEALSPERRRRTQRVMAVAAALTLGIGGFAYSAAREGPGPCDSIASELDGVWDERVRAQLQEAFLGTGAAFAADAYNTSAKALDNYATQWTQVRERSCVAARVDKLESPELFGRKMVCLGRRLAELEAFTREMSEADDAAVKKSVQAVSALGAVADCEDPQLLASVEVEVDEKTRAQIDAIDRVLVRGQTKLQLGRYAQALDIAKQAVQDSKDLGRARLEARALLLLGQVQGNLRQLDEAERSLREALRRADVARDDTTRVKAWSWLLHWVGYKKRDFAQAEVMAADARAALERMGEVPLLEAELYQRLGSIASASGDLEGAIEHHQAALDIRVRELGERSVDVAKSRNNLGNALLHKGDHAGAERELRAALSGFEELQGPSHPYVAITLGNIGASVAEQGRASLDPSEAKAHYENAEALYRRAIDVNARVYGPNHRSVAVSVHNLGELLRRLDRPADALKQYDRALRLKIEVFGATHLSVAASRSGRGAALAALGEVEEARAELSEALRVFDAPDSGVPPDVVGECAFALAKIERAPQATQLAQRAAAAYAKAGPAFTRELGEVRAWLDENK